MKITHNLIDNPILKEQIINVKELSELKIGNQGTNFASTKQEFEKFAMSEGISIPSSARQVERKPWIKNI